MNENKVISVVFGSVILISLILLSIRMQISMIEGADKASVKTNERLGYKAAGSFRLMVEEDSYFGNISSSRAGSIESGCTIDMEGFSANEPLRASFGDEICNEDFRPLRVPVRVETDNGFKIRIMNIGESNEGFEFSLRRGL